VRDGLVVVDKAPRWTSHDVVAKLRGVYGQRRVGHAGTLDPDATGVLLVGLGRATRLLRFLQEAGKEYRARVVFGVATDTLDAAASGVLVRRLINRLELPLTRDAAVCIYAALVCDTGRFQYQSTTPAVFELARELACFDLPIPELSRTLFEEHRFAYLQLLAGALQSGGGKLAGIIKTLSERKTE